MLKIQIYGEDFDYINNIFNEINLNIHPKAEIVRISSDENDCIEYLEKYRMDILLLDLDKIDTEKSPLIKFMQNGNNFTRFVIISNNPKKSLNLVNNGVKIYYSFNKKKKISELVDVIDNLVSVLNERKNKLLDFLQTFSFNKSSTGFKILFETLQYCVNNGYTYVENIRNLYDEINKYYGDTPYTRAYWNVEKAIETMGKTTDENLLRKYFNYNMYPTSKVFINTALQVLNA